MSAVKTKIEKVAIESLVSDPANVRKHGERNIQTIVASLHRFGQQKPIVIDKRNIVRAGNGTLEAARSLGWTHLDCVRTSLEGGEAVAYSIADNRTAELAEWDDDLLAAQLNGLLTEDEELLKAAGFDDEELSKLLKVGGEEDTQPQLSGLRYQVIVECDTEQIQCELLEKFNDEGLQCRALIV